MSASRMIAWKRGSTQLSFQELLDEADRALATGNKLIASDMIDLIYKALDRDVMVRRHRLQKISACYRIG